MTHDESTRQLLNQIEEKMKGKRVDVTIKNIFELDWRFFIKSCQFADATEDEKEMALRTAFFTASAAILAQKGLVQHLDECREGALWTMTKEELKRLKESGKISSELENLDRFHL